MTEKPRQWHTDYASIFKDKSVVEAYQFRPGYPPEVFEIVRGLLQKMPKPWRVLDVGCGTGFIARELISYVETIDAVDFSQAMIEMGKTLPNGTNPNLNWIWGLVEEAALRASYSLIVAAASLHWMAWEKTLPRFAEVLDENGYLAIVEDISLPSSWDKEVGKIISHYSLNKEFQPYTMLTVVKELEGRNLFEQVGQKETRSVVFQQSIDDWLESLHARNGFSRDRMTVEAAQACDEALREVIARYCPNDVVERRIKGRVIWGRPKSC